MQLLGLKGFSSFGRIKQYFTSGCFPQKWDWRPNDLRFVHDEYTKYLKTLSVKELVPLSDGLPTVEVNSDYILVCYSDGGLLGHIIAATDSRCKGLIAHSATFDEQRLTSMLLNVLYADLELKRYSQSMKPILLIENNNDLTRWLPSRYGRTKQALDFYDDLSYPLEYHRLPGETWHGHDFTGLSIMKSWCQRMFNYNLPVKVAYL